MNVNIIAKKFLILAQSENKLINYDAITDMCYAAYGISLTFDNILFRNDIVALKDGPFIYDLFNINELLSIDDQTINDVADSSIKLVWNLYSDYLKQLKEMVAGSGTPWSVSYDKSTINIIDDEVIKKYFSNLVESLEIVFYEKKKLNMTQ